MATSILDLKRRQASTLEAINRKIKEDDRGGQFPRDERYWQPLVDKEGNGLAVIRYLPAPDGEDDPYVRKFSHNFKGNSGKWYIENCLTTIGEKDPVAEYNSELWDTGVEANKNIARKQKRKLGFISNIQVIRHAARPEDEGKVFLFGYGKKIFDKLNDKMNPPEEDLAAVNPFDPWTGANFRLRICKVGDFRNYDNSQFDPAGPLGTDEQIEEIWRKCYSLKAEVARDKFKPYGELKKKLHEVLGLAASAEEPTEEAPAQESAPAAKVASEPAQIQASAGGEASQDLAFFENLAKN